MRKQKHLLLYLISYILWMNVAAQSNKPGVISGNVGADAAIHLVGLGKAGITAYPILATGGFITAFPLELNIGIFKPISVGVNYSPSRLIIGGVVGRFSTMGFNFNIYPINKNRFNMALSLTPSIIKFEPVSFYFDQDNNINLNFKGTGFRTRLLFNIYFSDNAGMYIGLGYSSYKIGIKDYKLLLSDQELEEQLNDLLSQDFKLNAIGLSGSIGVVFKLEFSKKDKDNVKKTD